ncbi:flagellar hook-associated protein FlgL [Caballeronia arationis]|jgi:flagellar hook-associated protein 3 FlgL|uniref:Flagellar hook-associated protein 3 n=1 Tax=Caballeronia arationis TaxID=1777142 RepID=A0A7Z7I7B3_9BURK|nr:flagellar hook-associated protein FlgL [Caballeronia arationis]SAK42396.1 flagellar hook-associated protein FlgL [Caballeronia arationis]SOE80151.1 flagellar hook-associated protein 3 [Caballeronia arationis]
MRISSSQYFTMNVQTMSDQQSSLASMYAQISSGNRLQTSSDDPLGAAQAVQLTIKTAALSQYATNQSTALSSLQQEDSTLSSVSDVLQSIQTQIVRAGDASLNDSNRSSIADQIKGYRDQLMNLANTTDSNGNYIFAGFKSGSAAFTDNPSGVGASYSGDLGQRQVQVNDGRTISVGDTGASIFQSVSPTESTPVSAAGSANKGSGTISSVSVTDTSNAANANSYTISFAVSSTGNTTYTVNPSPDGSPVTPVAYTGKTDVTLGGEKVTLDGTPSDGDTFSVGPAASSGTDIFATLDNLVNALKQPTGTDAQKATLSNALTTASTKVDNSFNNVLSVQATVGGREQEVTATQSSMQTTATQTASNLADLTSINLVSAISQYELTQNALQGAQMAFSQIQKMSLFDYISG